MGSRFENRYSEEQDREFEPQEGRRFIRIMN
jgi:hypothetical protein